MTSSKKEEERNEKIIRGLLKLPPNRRCINCNSLGPQYVCTSFWTFICVACSGIHREFTHRVKSVSMSKFTTQEVEALQRGGNQRARESFLRDLDPQQARLPGCSNIDNLREFIKAVYVDKIYAGGRFSERPPRDMQNKANDEHRRASSYHSYSQSPPYDYQYEERRNGKQNAMLSRKPGSDRGNYEGKISNFAYSPGSLHEKMYEDRFANESCGSIISDCSGSSIGDPFRTDCQSPNFQDAGYSSSPAQQAETNIKIPNGVAHSQGTASSGSIDTISMKSAKSASLGDMLLEPGHGHGTQQIENSVPPSFANFSSAANANNQDRFNLPVAQQQPGIGSSSPIDLFADISCQPLTTPSAEKAVAASSSENLGWATFDTPTEEPQSRVNGFSSFTTPSKFSSFTTPSEVIQNRDLFSSLSNNPTPWFQASDTNALFTDQLAPPAHEVKGPIGTSSSQSWSAFDDAIVSMPKSLSGTSSIVNSVSQESKGAFDENSSQLWHSFDDMCGNMDHNLSSNSPQTNDQQNVVNVSLTSSNPFTSCVIPEQSYKDDSQKLYMGEVGPSGVPFVAFVEPSPLSAVPSTEGISSDQKSTNPFDLPSDSDLEALNMFVDMSALQETLPNPQLPAAFMDSLPETWFSHGVASYVPPVSHGGLPFLVDQAPSSPLRNLTPSAVQSLSGNPFA